MKRAVIYTRFSCSKQREASIDDQIRVCSDWCNSNGYQIVQIYSDYAQSGRTDDRPEFQRMISSAGESEIVLVYMMDRFSRDRYDSIIYKKKLRDKGVKVVSATEAIPDSPEAILIESVYEAMAAMESANTSKRVRRGMEGNAMKCHYNGVYIFGYDIDHEGHYVVNETEARIVREVFRRKIDGEPVNSIQKDLAARGIGARGKPASYGFVRGMLNNERYTGIYKWGSVRVVDGMPRIITDEEFQEAASVVPKKQPQNENWSDYPLSGMLICGECGRAMSGASGRNHDGNKYRYYRCKHCGDVKPVRADWLEEGVAESIRELLEDRETALEIARTTEELTKDKATEASIKDLRKRSKAAQEAIESLVTAVSQGFDPKRAQERINELEGQIEALDREIAASTFIEKLDLEQFADFLQFGATLTDDDLLETLVYQVRLSDTEVLVTLDFDKKKGEPARLSLPPVRPIVGWWTLKQNSRTVITIIDGSIILRFPRAA